MFVELVPLLKHRVVMITVSDVGDGVLRVNVIPRKLDADQNQALTTPLSITGSAEELDRELPGQLTSFTESVVKTGSNLEELRTQHAAAVKAVEAENKKKLDEKRKGSGAKTASAPPAPSVTPEFKDGKPLSGASRRQDPASAAACSTRQRTQQRTTRWARRAGMIRRTARQQQAETPCAGPA